MRIAIVAPPWVPVPPPTYGGTEAVLDTLARGLQSAGHDVMLFTTGDSTCPVPTCWVRPEAAGTIDAGPPTELQHVVRAYAAAAEWGADVVHDHTIIGPAYASGRFSVPVVTTNHGPFSGELGDCYRAIGGMVPIIALSAPHAASAGDIEVETVIHHGIDIDDYQLGDGAGGYAAFLGRMCPDKGVHVAARVARQAGIPLRIAAKMREPAEEEYFEREVEPLLGDGVEYVGEVGGTDKVGLLGGARCLLNPLQWEEPFGMVMIEALACGTPVVATPFGSVPDLVTDGATGAIRASEADLAAALDEVGTLDRARCRDEVARRFSADLMVARHVELFERLVAHRATTPPVRSNGATETRRRPPAREAPTTA